MDIKSYLHVTVLENNRTYKKERGIVQGSGISPVLSNLYLHELDLWLEENGYHWLRYADNIYVYTKSREEGNQIFSDIIYKISQGFDLEINQGKSGVYDAIARRVLGYEFYLSEGKVDCRRYQYKPVEYYRHWSQTALSKVNNQYYILEDGILNKQDYALVFENEDKKYHIPVGVVEYLNIYSDVMITPAVFNILSNRGIKVSFYNKYDKAVGYFVPEKMAKPANFVLAQAKLYLDQAKRLEVAKKFEHTGIYQMRAILKYYQQRMKDNVELTQAIDYLTGCLKEVNEVIKVDDLMLIEARARQKYYMCFNQIIDEAGFAFTIRTKRPPKDAINAMISFGNTILYNRILSLIWRTGLDPRFGIVHASNRRSYSLNLDFADYFKPIIVDRVIFSLINHHQIKLKEHFEGVDQGGVYFNHVGKRMFIKAFENM